EVRAQTMPYQRRRSGGRQYGVYQFKQAILAKAQVVVQLLAEVAERCQSLRFRHTPSLTRFPLYRKTPRQSGPSFVQTQDPERSEGSRPRSCHPELARDLGSTLRSLVVPPRDDSSEKIPRLAGSPRDDSLSTWRRSPQSSAAPIRRRR